jgi:hypothetical protein
MLVAHPANMLIVRMIATDHPKPYPMEVREGTAEKLLRFLPNYHSVVRLAREKDFNVSSVGCVPRYFATKDDVTTFLAGHGLKIGVNGNVKISTRKTK